jgi:opacity protein-like surface antigen
MNPTMQIRKLLIPAFVLGAAALARPAQAQNLVPLSIEIRGGAVLPQGDLNDAANPGWTLGGTVHYRIVPMVSIYGGLEHSQFAADDDVSGGTDGSSVSDDGFRLGARFDVPLGAITGVSPWLEGGATFSRTSFSASDDATDISVDINSKRTVGFEVGAGLNFSVAPRIDITPGVRYRSHTADFGDAEEDGLGKFDANSLAIDVGVRIRM